MRFFGFCFFLIVSIDFVNAQDENQVWLDFQMDYPTAKSWLYEMTTSYQTVVNADHKWRSISIIPDIEYTYFRHFDFIGLIPVSYTMQKENFNTLDIVPTLGGRVYFTPGKRIDARFITKVEERFFYQAETSEWDLSNRLRFKGEVYFSINGPSLFTDNLWYAVADYEEFVVVDKQLDERYSNRRRGRLGLGYRKNYRNRFELFYCLQFSRNEIGSEYESQDNIIQLRYKIFLNPAK
jgi:hypothetical protein